MENTHLSPALAPAPGCFLFKCSSMQVVLPWKASSALHVLHKTAFFVWSFVKLSHTLLVRTLLHSIIIRAVCPSTAFRRAAYTLALQRRSGQIVILQALSLGHVIKRLLDNKNIYNMSTNRFSPNVIRCIFKVQLYSLGSLVVGQLSWQIAILLVENHLHMTEFDLFLLEFIEQMPYLFLWRASSFLNVPSVSLVHVALFQAAVCEGRDSGRPGWTRQIQAGAGADAEWADQRTQT